VRACARDTGYDAVVELLKTHFLAPQSALLQQILFRQQHQLLGENVANLRGLASACKFGVLQDEIIRDQLIEHTNKAKVRETLFLEVDDLSLSRALTIALQVESMAECAAMLTKQQVATFNYAAPSLHSRLKPS